jgi:hypothetical protein
MTKFAATPKGTVRHASAALHLVDEIIDKVAPELQRRSVFRKDYEGRTLRENLGLPAPTAQESVFRGHRGRGRG